MEQSMFEAVAKYGLGTVLSVGIFLLCVWIVKYVIKLSHEQIIRFADVIDKLANKIDTHEQRSDEAHKYAREEHKSIIECLHRMNGTKKESV